MDNSEFCSVPNFKNYANEFHEEYYPSNEYEPDEYFELDKVANPVAAIPADNGPIQDLEDFSEELPERVKGETNSKEIDLNFYRPFLKDLMDIEKFLKETQDPTLLRILDPLHGFTCEFLHGSIRDPKKTKEILERLLSQIKDEEELIYILSQNKEQIQSECPDFQYPLPPTHVIEWISKLVKFLEESLNWMNHHSNITFSIKPESLKIQGRPLYEFE